MSKSIKQSSNVVSLYNYTEVAVTVFFTNKPNEQLMVYLAEKFVEATCSNLTPMEFYNSNREFLKQMAAQIDAMEKK